jgi:hypothetical protein
MRTRLSTTATPGRNYGSFAGKTPFVSTGSPFFFRTFIMSRK